MPGLIPVICVAGPTGSGKSSMAAHLGERLNGTVINADSRQVYRDFPVITAQPGQEERSCCPHELYGVCAITDTVSAGQYAENAAAMIRSVHAAGRLPIVTGGTGLYINALLVGLPAMPAVPPAVSAHWRERVDREGPEELHRVLSDIDPVCAARIHPRDSQRISRALEIHAASGMPLSHWQRQPVPPSPFRVLWLYVGLPLAELAPRLEKRIADMLEQGALDEARAAMALCRNPAAPGWSGIGCAELFRHLAGEWDLDEARRQWIANTRSYAKRQITWFRKEERWQRLAPGEQQAALEAAAAFLDRKG